MHCYCRRCLSLCLARPGDRWSDLLGCVPTGSLKILNISDSETQTNCSPVCDGCTHVNSCLYRYVYMTVYFHLEVDRYYYNNYYRAPACINQLKWCTKCVFHGLCTVMQITHANSSYSFAFSICFRHAWLQLVWNSVCKYIVFHQFGSCNETVHPIGHLLIDNYI